MTAQSTKRPRHEVLSGMWQQTQKAATLNAPAVLAAPHPKLLVLDLDQTLWPFDAANPRYVAPQRATAGAEVIQVQCESGVIAKPFPQAIAILQAIAALDIPAAERWRVGVASANSSKPACISLLNAMGLLMARTSLPHSQGGMEKNQQLRGIIEPELLEIHPGSKREHLEKLAALSGVAFHDMIFFDDLRNNISTAERLGVVAQQVSPLEGLTWATFAKGVESWRSRRRSGAMLTSWLKPSAATSATAEEPADETAQQPRRYSDAMAGVIDLIDSDASADEEKRMQ